MTGPNAVAGAEFAGLLDRLGPFEPRPRLAVGVSGGADSMALCLLADGWARARGGSVLALTVDHGLRPESAAEARQVGAWLAARGVPHAVLAWIGPKPASGLQEAARAARHALLEERCRVEGILHLLLAHHREDQAETVLLRLARGSGPDGLAAMPAVRDASWVRVLRPLLDVQRARLAATLASLGQPWVEDPSNRSMTHARPRLRRSAAALAEEGLSAAGLAETARRCGAARAVLEGATADLLARAAEAHPEGFVLVDAAALAEAAPELRLRALQRCLEAVGGGGPVRRERLERLAASLPKGGTLGGCLVRPWRGRLLVAREPEAAAETISPVGREPRRWDRRFLVGTGASGEFAGLRVARLGAAGRLALKGQRGDDGGGRLPAPVLAALPAFWAGERLVSVPSIGVRLDGSHGVEGHWVAFAPPRALCGPPFATVPFLVV